jgi:hypothetical protein
VWCGVVWCGFGFGKAEVKLSGVSVKVFGRKLCKNKAFWCFGEPKAFFLEEI